MAGNSWLSIAQINFASRLSHPALKALAPWESLNDPYRDSTARGGMPHNRAFQQLVMMGFAGPNYAENLGEMLEKRPLYDSYWESKLIKTERIGEIPLYLLASYSSGLHTKGSFHTFRTAKSSRKWLRVHPYQEWYDLYRPEITDELQRYFDRYCKGIENGWEHDTPPVRLSLLGFDGSAAETVIERPEQEYPLARQKPQLHYLDASIGKLVPELPARESTVSHLGHDLHASSVRKPQQTLVAELNFCSRTLVFTLAKGPRLLAMPKLDSGCPVPRRTTWMSLSKSERSHARVSCSLS